MNEPDAAQRAAMRHGEGPALVVAGPGSGKTYTMTGRIAYLTDELKVDPSSILTLTFTKAAAKEMMTRAHSFIGDRASRITFGTFHSAAFSILKHTFGLTYANILKPSEKYIILRDLIIKAQIETPDMTEAVDELSSLISCGSSQGGYFESETAKALMLEYKETLKKSRKLDFNDMLKKCRNLLLKDPNILSLWQDRYRFIQVDEFQDTDSIQYELIKLLAGKNENIYAVGDDDQSIYGFRGGSAGIMQQFIAEHRIKEDEAFRVSGCSLKDDISVRELKIYELGKNYRCSRPVVEAAVKVISENEDRIKKNQTAFVQTGEAIDIRGFDDRDAEMEEIVKIIKDSEPGQTAVLVRTNELAEIFASGLSRKGLRVDFKGRIRNIYKSEAGEDVMSYIRIALGRYTRNDLFRVMNKPDRGMGREAFATEPCTLEAAALFYRRVPEIRNNAECFAEDMKRMKGMKPKNAIRYLMKVVGYERYLLCNKAAYNDLCELAGIAGHYNSLEQWLKGADMAEETGESRMKRTERKGETAGEDKTDKKDDTDRADKIQINSEKSVNILTLHACKGLEYREVFIADVNDGIIPYHRAKLKAEIEEERRLFYVGITRAEKKLHIFYTRGDYGKAREPS
nr:ATP-dependent helicase [Lachnospiraceae bacterium]